VTTVVIPAAGSGKRFGSALPKQYLVLGGVPIIARTMLAFEHARGVDAIVVAAAPEFHENLRAMAQQHAITKLHEIVEGGAERQDSIAAALQTASVLASELVLVHDAVRPFVTSAFVESLAEAARAHGAAVPGLMPKETVKEIAGEVAGEIVAHTHDRSALRLVQTPQAFRREVLTAAYGVARAHGFVGTDDASVVEFANSVIGVVGANGVSSTAASIRIIAGLEENIKITTPMDWHIAELLVRQGL
jgi:2-C-methyl-D-erythritol 4-phosphate cytidylyltransferase